MLGPIELIELEMADTTWEQSCHNPVVLPTGDLRECRRAKGHTGTHASGNMDAGSFAMWKD